MLFINSWFSPSPRGQNWVVQRGIEEITWEVHPTLHPWRTICWALQGISKVDLCFASLCGNHIHSGITWQWHAKIESSLEYKLNMSLANVFPSVMVNKWSFRHLLFWNFKSSMRQEYNNIYHGKQSGLPVYMTHFQIFLWKRNWRCYPNNSCLAINYLNKPLIQDYYWKSLFRAI